MLGVAAGATGHISYQQTFSDTLRFSLDLMKVEFVYCHPSICIQLNEMTFRGATTQIKNKAK